MIENLKQYTLLVAEDEPNTLRETLLYFGHYFRYVFQAKDGKQALAVFKEESPDVVILDISMPYMSGLKVAEQINKLNQDTHVVILSAHNEQPTLLQAIEMDLFSFIVKPLNRKNAKELLVKLAQKFKTTASNLIVINTAISYECHQKSIILKDKGVIRLSKNETLLLEYMLKHKNRVLSIEQMIHAIYPNSKTLRDANACVKTLISGLKYKAPNLPICNKYGLGYLLEI